MFRNSLADIVLRQVVSWLWKNLVCGIVLLDDAIEYDLIQPAGKAESWIVMATTLDNQPIWNNRGQHFEKANQINFSDSVGSFVYGTLGSWAIQALEILIWRGRNNQKHICPCCSDWQCNMKSSLDSENIAEQQKLYFLINRYHFQPLSINSVILSLVSRFLLPKEQI